LLIKRAPINSIDMKKILILLTIVIAAFGQLWGQTLTDAEYYFDSDPGVGNGTTIAVTSNDTIEKTYNFSVGELAPGFHNLFIRVKDDLGRWGLVRRHLFYVFDDTPVDLSITQPDLAGFEYFFDKDQGVGTGTWVAATPDSSLIELVNFSTAGLAPGFHQLMVRAKDVTGRWGHYYRGIYYVFDDTYIDLTKVSAKIVAAEYFFNKDSVSQGQGVSIPITEGDSVDWTGGVSVDGLSAGEHTLYIRVKDALGVWSIVATKQFNVVNLVSQTNSPICQGSDEGEATVTIQGGTPPYTYYWNDPLQQSDSTATGLTAGTYTVTVTDNTGAVLKESVTITEFDTIDIDITTSDTDCQTSEGSATALATSENGGEKYLWSNGSDEASATNLSSGIYVVTVTDAAGCTNTGVAAINDIGGPVISITGVQDLVCGGDVNGIIDIDVTGGTSPYTYSWSNGETTQDIINLTAGNYEVTVADMQGCFASMSIEVKEPQPITFSISVTDASCGISDGVATVTPSGGTPGYTYDWDGFSAPHNANRTALEAGVYKVTVTDSESCSSDVLVTVSEDGAPSVNVISVTESTCGNTDGSVLISVAGATGTPTFEWQKDNIQVSTDEDLTGVGPGEYTVSVTDGGCTAYATATIPAELPPTELICLVTVDTVTNKNMIIWDETPGKGIVRYNIYRETTSAGVFDWIDSVSVDSLSYYVDEFADPAVRSWRYKISSVNSCGVESRLSPPHKTMHLTINQGLAGSINLIWNHYEGFTPKDNQYRIWRWAASTGWLEPDVPVPSNLNSWSDFSVPDEDVWYYVEAVHLNGCTPEKASTLNSTRSNRRNKQQATGIGENAFMDEYQLRVWPNPSAGVFNLNFEYKDVDDLNIKVFDISGKLVLTRELRDLYSGVDIKLDLSGFEKGMYQLHLESGAGVYNKILVIQ
jgi:hypothetical protein